MNSLLYTKDEILMQKAKILSGFKMAWSEIGCLIASVEHYGEWVGEAHSFTNWVKIFSELIKKQESSCWRYLAAAKYYLGVVDKLSEAGVVCPKLSLLSDKSSAENFELLSKLERVLPDAIFINFAQRVINNNIKRHELREAWVTFRPILEGRTARGEKVPPTINRTDEKQSKNLHEAIGVRLIMNSKGDWLNLKKSYFFRTFREIDIPIVMHDKNYVVEADVLVVTGSKVKQEVNFHLVEYAAFLNPDLINKLLALTEKVNFVWLISYQANLNISINNIPSRVGVLQIQNENEFVVLRNAEFNEINQTNLLKSVFFRNI